MSIYDFLVVILRNGLGFALIAVLIERLIITFGWARGNTIGLAIGSFLMAILKQVIDPVGPLYLYCLFIAIAGPMAVNRVDLLTTFEHGRWWWKSPEGKPDV